MKLVDLQAIEVAVLSSPQDHMQKIIRGYRTELVLEHFSNQVLSICGGTMMLVSVNDMCRSLSHRKFFGL